MERSRGNENVFANAKEHFAITISSLVIIFSSICNLRTSTSSSGMELMKLKILANVKT